MSATPTVYYHEDQHFRGSMLWVLIAMLLGVALSVVGAVARTRSLGVVPALVILAGVMVLFAVARLETEVRSDAIYVHFHGLWPTRRIPLEKIVSYEARRYTIWDSGGWGVHLGLSGMTYNVSGNEGLRFQLQGGTPVLVGTQRPAEFVAAIATAMAARGQR